MARDQPGTKERILHAAYKLFYRQGFTRVSVDAVADRAGVTKRTVYYHFRSKDHIIAAVMEEQHLHLISQYRTWLEPSSDTPSKIISDVFSNLGDWATDPSWMGSGFSRIAAELADLPGHPARRASSTHKAAVEEWLAVRLAAAGAKDAEELARQVFLLIEGGMSLALIHGDTEYIRSAKSAAERLARVASI
jgi:AcrR family transcriptional regulator